MDVDLSSIGCHGIALDPTVSHHPEIAPGVLFLKLGAPSLEAHDWQVMSLTRLWEWLGRRSVWALKYDCEGCEYAMITEERDYLFEAFLAHVHQINIEFHLHRGFMTSREKLNNLVHLLGALKRSGLQLAHRDTAWCGGVSLALGERTCRNEIYEAGLPCDGVDCSSYLFVRRT
jgi:hypothetical protein